jgi:hypothetical protein
MDIDKAGHDQKPASVDKIVNAAIVALADEFDAIAAKDEIAAVEVGVSLLCFVPGDDPLGALDAGSFRGKSP